MIHLLRAHKIVFTFLVLVSLTTIMYQIFYVLMLEHPHPVLQTNKTHHIERLYKWTPADVVPENIGSPGELGDPVNLRESRELFTRFKEHEFNILASDMIMVNRSLMDPRHPDCLKATYSEELLGVSVIIAFHNEAWSTLIRTVMSVINRSPKELLKEIILVDDDSTIGYLGNRLDHYVKRLPAKVYVTRMSERSGVISSRLHGAEKSIGDVLIFLDSHCECAEGWLEPLLDRVTKNRHTIAVPHVDTIDKHNFEYVITDIIPTGFNWKMESPWTTISEDRLDLIKDKTEPLPASIMPGGMFCVDKEFFLEIGSFDRGMIMYGGENVELSFRAWMCGGRIEIVRCSHIGHIFRKHFPYRFPEYNITFIMAHNSNRIANLWLDEDRNKFYYFLNPDRVGIDSGNIYDIRSLKMKLLCKNIDWYVKNVFPEMDLLTKYRYIGHISNGLSKKCLAVKDTIAEIHRCNDHDKNQPFIYINKTLRNHLNCLSVDSVRGSVLVIKCDQTDNKQKWDYNETTANFINKGNGCLTQVHQDKPDLITADCDGGANQKWRLKHKKHWQKLPDEL